MPLTPIAVSAWRTSSSLNGLIMATTSFMVRPSFPGFQIRLVAACVAPTQVWHLSVRMAQKVAGVDRKTMAVDRPHHGSSLYRHRVSPPRCDFIARDVVGTAARQNP